MIKSRSLLGPILLLSVAFIVTAGVERNTVPDKPSALLEVTLSGKGMVWPNRVTRVFFRLFENGRLEYESRTRRGLVTKTKNLKASDVEDFIRLAETPSFLQASEKYEALERLGDASLTTTLTYKHKSIAKRVTIINYQPTHPQASTSYPPGLLKLLEKVVEQRPRTNFERTYGLDTVALPYEGSAP